MLLFIASSERCLIAAWTLHVLLLLLAVHGEWWKVALTLLTLHWVGQLFQFSRRCRTFQSAAALLARRLPFPEKDNEESVKSSTCHYITRKTCLLLMGLIFEELNLFWSHFPAIRLC